MYGAFVINSSYGLTLFSIAFCTSCLSWGGTTQSSWYKIFSPNSTVISSNLENIKFFNETISNINRENISSYYNRKEISTDEEIRQMAN